MNNVSDQQVEYIEKLCKWKGEQFAEDAVRELSKDEASRLIDELKALDSVRKTAKQFRQDQHMPHLVVNTFNPIQMGMVKKYVADQSSPEWIAANYQKFSKDCLEVYNAFEAADALVKMKYPEVKK